MEKEDLLDKLIVTEIKTQSDYLADKIRDMIISGDFGDNYKFPNEMEFSKKLNVSRTTLREAYKVLATQGFLRVTKQGTYIKNRDAIAKQGDFAASLDLADEQEMLEFVCALEPAAVALAAKKMNAKSLAKLQTLMEACEAVADNTKALMEKNYTFHAYIRELSDNTLIQSALAAYYDIFNNQIVGEIYSALADTSEFKAESLKQHRELFHALKNNDEKKAQEITYRHLQNDIETHHLRLHI